jgi:hypothetical protein
MWLLIVDAEDDARYAGRLIVVTHPSPADEGGDWNADSNNGEYLPPELFTQAIDIAIGLYLREDEGNGRM